MKTTAYFDASTVDTPAGLAATISASDVTGIPSEGTGLLGAAKQLVQWFLGNRHCRHAPLVWKHGPI